MSKIFVDTIEPKTTANTGSVVKIRSAFQVGLASNQAASGTTKVNFVTGGTVFQDYDLNNDFNNSDNRFTAPVAGIYVFHVSIYDGSAGDNTYGIQLYINGSRKQNVIMTKANSPTNESFTGGTTTYKMEANDYAQIYHVASGGGITINANSYHTYWQGYIVGGV